MSTSDGSGVVVAMRAQDTDDDVIFIRETGPTMHFFKRIVGHSYMMPPDEHGFGIIMYETIFADGSVEHLDDAAFRDASGEYCQYYISYCERHGIIYDDV